MKYQAYDEYKDSVVEWIEKIPEHWGTSKLRYMFSFDKGLTITKENLLDEGVPCVNYGEVHSKYGFEVDPVLHPLKCVSERYLKSSKSSLLSQGDLVFADTSEDIDGSGNFTQLISDQPVFAGYHTIIARPKDRQSSRFYAYLFDSQEFRTQIKYAVKGVKVFSITQAILKSVDIWLPKLDERKKIANFLDHETAKIDTLIEKQQLLIKLLKEKRQAVISHAVTKGLNPNAPMRDSGVEWLGEVPEHWVTIKFGITNSSADLGGNYSSGDGEEGIPLIKMGNLGRGRVKLKKLEFIQKSEVYEKKYLLSEGDFLFNTRNSLALVGKVSIWRGELEKSLYNSNILKITFYEKFVGSNSFMNYLFNSDFGLSQLRLIAKGTTSVAAIYYKELKSLIYALPTPKEQVEISSFLDSESEKIGYLIEKSESAIELMQERRTALISAAVTGKIDVRNWQAPNSESKAISA